MNTTDYQCAYKAKYTSDYYLTLPYIIPVLFALYRFITGCKFIFYFNHFSKILHGI